MDDQADPGEEVVLQVQLELGLNRRPIRGRLRTERGTDEQFVGWIGFVDALKRLQERGDATATSAATRSSHDRYHQRPTDGKERP